MTTASARFEFDVANNGNAACALVDDNHVLATWRGTAGFDGIAQILEVNTTTWVVSTAAALLEFDTQNGNYSSIFEVDTNHFITFWGGGAGTTGYVQVLEVNTSTWAVTTSAASLEHDTQGGSYNSCYKIDTNHFIDFYQGLDGDGFVQVIEVNTTTWAVSTASARLEFETQSCLFNTCFEIDANHFINFWAGNLNDGFVQVFEVNTTTWAVTTAGAPLEFDTQNGSYGSCFKIDANHFIHFFRGDLGNDGYAQVFEVNTSTWAVTTAGGRFEFDTQNGLYNTCWQVDTNHFVHFWGGLNNDGFVGTVEVNTSTWEITTTAAMLEHDTQQGNWNRCCKIDTSHFINLYSGVDNDGFAQVVNVNVPAAPSGGGGSFNTEVLPYYLN